MYCCCSTLQMQSLFFLIFTRDLESKPSWGLGVAKRLLEERIAPTEARSLESRGRNRCPIVFFTATETNVMCASSYDVPFEGPAPTKHVGHDRHCVRIPKLCSGRKTPRPRTRKGPLRGLEHLKGMIGRLKCSCGCKKKPIYVAIIRDNV